MNKLIFALTCASSMLTAQVAYAQTPAQVIPDDVIVSNASDGSANAYDCTAERLPFLIDQGTIIDPRAAVGTIPFGEIVQEIKPDFREFEIDPEDSNVLLSTYTCEAIPSGLCAGQDCFNNINLNNKTLTVAENNTRITMLDTDVAINAGVEAVFGQKWNLEANDSRNAGENYFGIQVKSAFDDSAISFGSEIDFRCEDLVGVFFPSSLPQSELPNNGFIPYGLPYKRLEAVDSRFSDGIFEYEWACTEPEPRPLVNPAMVMGQNTSEEVDDGLGGTVTVNNIGSVILGTQERSYSPGQSGQVYAGTPAIKRQLKFVADAIASTDIVNMRSLSLPRIEALKDTIAELNVVLDNVNAKINVIEKADINNDGCIDRTDLSLLGSALRRPNPGAEFDLDGNGSVNRVDMRALVDLFTNPRGLPCI